MMSDLGTLRAEYERLREEVLIAYAPESPFMIWMGLPTFNEWLAEQDIEPPAPDPSDPYTRRRLDQYATFREHAFRNIAPEARPSVERYFISFDHWLHGVEGHERFFPNDPCPSIVK